MKEKLPVAVAMKKAEKKKNWEKREKLENHVYFSTVI